jgi:hypothetical protein
MATLRQSIGALARTTRIPRRSQRIRGTASSSPLGVGEGVVWRETSRSYRYRVTVAASPPSPAGSRNDLPRLPRRNKSTSTESAPDNDDDDVPCRLALGGNQLSKTDPHKYLRIVRSALEHGIRTIEAPSASALVLVSDDGEAQGAGGGEEVLASTLRSLLQENTSLQSRPIEVLVRVGYQTKGSSSMQAGDVLVETLPRNNSPGKDGGFASSKDDVPVVVVHNLTGAAVRDRLEASPLSQLSHDFRNVHIVPLLHNPEQQRSPREIDAAALQALLQDSLATLEAMCQDGAIARFGMVSNGLCLPTGHPLHLPVNVAVDAARQYSGYQVTQLPLNALETTGIAVSEQLAQRIGPSPTHEVYAMRPLACYPNRGTGAGHPFVLADLLIPEFVSGLPVTGSGGSDGSAGTEDAGSGGSSVSWGSAAAPGPPPQLRWTNELPDSVPAAYERALKVSMQYFDAEELVQAKLEGKPLTAEQRETLDGCKLLQSLFHDLDAGLSKQRSLAAHEQYLTDTVIPLIHDTFEAYDEESAQVLEQFFATYTVAVRHAIAKNTRALLQGGEATSFDGGDMDSSTTTTPVYTIPPTMRLQEFGLSFVLQQSHISKVVVGATEVDQVVENVHIASRAHTLSLEMDGQ